MNNTNALLIYIIALISSIIMICVIDILKRELREQKRFRRDFYDFIAKYDFDLTTQFYKNKIKEFESNEFSLKNGTHDQ